MKTLKGVTTRDFFDSLFLEKIKKDPHVLSSSGLKSQTIAINIEGEGGGSWFLNFGEMGEVLLTSSESKVRASCEILTSAKTFEGLLDGSVNVPMAFMFRKIRVQGESALAVKLGLALQRAITNKT